MLGDLEGKAEADGNQRLQPQAGVRRLQGGKGLKSPVFSGTPELHGQPGGKGFKRGGQEQAPFPRSLGRSRWEAEPPAEVLSHGPHNAGAPSLPLGPMFPPLLSPSWVLF